MEKATSRTPDFEQVVDTAKEQLHEIESLMETLDGSVRRLATERPLVLLGGTLLLGYVAGRLLGGRR
jgi:hypothetical protein